MNLYSILKRLKDPNFRSILDSRFGIGRIEKTIFSNWFNPFLTLWLNFRCLPFKQAICLPIWVYGRARLYCLSGRITIKTKIKPRLIRFNIVKYGAPCNMSTQSELYNLGSIVFEGKCDIGTGTKIIVGHASCLSLGEKSVIMDRCIIAAHENITIGNNSRIAHNCQIFDTNFHFIANLNTMSIPKRSKKILIGSHCWICNSSTIMKGSCVPDYAIIGSHSVVNKDFSEYKDGCIIAGNPAKLVKQNYVRVFNLQIENEIWRYWNNNETDIFPIINKTKEELVKLI